LALGYAFRVFEWVLGGAGRSFAHEMLRVDILNCIGLSLVIAAYIASPADVATRRVPWAPALLALAVVFVTPAIERLRSPVWLPRALSFYITGPKPGASFPLFPWLAFLLAGCVAGAYWVRVLRGGALARTLLVGAVLGAALAVGGLVFRP